MFDEMIGLRLGLIPLKTPLDDFEVGDEGLSRSTSRVRRRRTPATSSADPLVEVADDNIRSSSWKEGQRLEFEADAVLDTGKEHAKHQGGVSVGYHHLQRVSVEGRPRRVRRRRAARILRGLSRHPTGKSNLPTSSTTISRAVPRERSQRRGCPRRVRVPHRDGRFVQRRGTAAPRHRLHRGARGRTTDESRGLT